MYSQADEEKYILEFFKDRSIGRLIEIGAYHPTVFSNSRALIEKGWSGVLVEPSPKCFGALEEFYKDNLSVITVNVAIGLTNGKLRFHDSGGAVGTAINEHYKRWRELQKDYEDIEVDCVSWDTFYNNFPGKYNFVSIDTEGMDYDILQQMNLIEMGVELLCIEYSYNCMPILQYLSRCGFTKHIYQNGENLMVGKNE